VRGGEKIKLQKNTEIRAEKGQTKKVSLGWHRDRKENPISAPSIHVGALVNVLHSGQESQFFLHCSTRFLPYAMNYCSLKIS